MYNQDAIHNWIRLSISLRAHADHVAVMYRDRAKELCADAGLDPNLLGIHPHNAMVSYDNGNPWPNVDYAKVKLCLWFLDNQFAASNEVDKLIRELYPKDGVKC